MEQPQDARQKKTKKVRQGWMGGAIGLGFIAGILVLMMVRMQGGNVRVMIIPADGARPAISSPIRMLFNRQVPVDSIEALFSIEPAASGQFTAAGQQAIFWPDEPLTSGVLYTVSLAEGMIDGNAFEGASVRFTPRPPEILFSRRTDLVTTHLYRLAEDGREVLLYENAAGIYSYASSPDGETVYLSATRGAATSAIIAIDREGRGERVLISCGEMICAGLTASPDGRFLAYEKRPVQQVMGGDSQVLLLDLGSQSEISVISYETIMGRSPTWGGQSRLGFFEISTGTLRVFDLDTGEKYSVTTEMGEMGDFSPDGSQLVYPEIRVVGGAFYPGLLRTTLSFEGETESLLADAQEDTAPAWSPDGRWIAFSRKRLDRQSGFFGQMALFDTRTGEVKVITDDPDRASAHFSWSPDSRQIAVGRYFISDGSSQQETWLYDVAGGSFMLAAVGGESPQWLP